MYLHTNVKWIIWIQTHHRLGQIGLSKFISIFWYIRNKNKTIEFKSHPKTKQKRSEKDIRKKDSEKSKTYTQLQILIRKLILLRRKKKTWKLYEK